MKEGAFIVHQKDRTGNHPFIQFKKISIISITNETLIILIYIQTAMQFIQARQKSLAITKYIIIIVPHFIIIKSIIIQAGSKQVLLHDEFDTVALILEQMLQIFSHLLHSISASFPKIRCSTCKFHNQQETDHGSDTLCLITTSPICVVKGFILPKCIGPHFWLFYVNFVKKKQFQMSFMNFMINQK